MSTWSPNPRIYEINTWVWLSTLSQQYGQSITLYTIPDEVLDTLASFHVDAIWLMGVWHRGPSTRASALNYIHEYLGVLPDIDETDVAGSAYAIGDYEVEDAIGGRDGMLHLRERLHQRGLRLILDFVPNHTGHDHPWLDKHLDYYIHGDADWLRNAPGEFFPLPSSNGNHTAVAYGRDPYFPGWVDTAQLNAFSSNYRRAAVRTLNDIATLADGVRCDMAMLMMNEVFMRSWGWLGLEMPQTEFWEYVIPRVKKKHPEFLFIAEAYWDMNYALLQQGFDYTYDKRMYDRLLNGDVNGIYAHLSADIGYLTHQIRFIENHDEHRAADAFGVERSRPAAVLISTLPGATLLHDGQFSGRKVKLPVQITRQPYESENPALRRFYLRLLKEVSHDIYHEGTWHLLRCYASCDGCSGAHNLVTYAWHRDDDLRIVVLNFSDEWSQGLVDLSPWAEWLGRYDWRLLDVLHRTYEERDSEELLQDGLYVDVEPHQAMIYHLVSVQKRTRRRKQAAAQEA